MPTPTGMLKAGDVIRNKLNKITCLVVERRGNAPDYSVLLEYVDGISKRQIRLLNAAWHLENNWELVEKEPIEKEPIYDSRYWFGIIVDEAEYETSPLKGILIFPYIDKLISEGGDVNLIDQEVEESRECILKHVKEAIKNICAEIGAEWEDVDV